MQNLQELQEQVRELKAENKQLYYDYKLACNKIKTLREIITQLEVKLTRKQKQLLEIQKTTNQL